jgi:hypothetical protein
MRCWLVLGVLGLWALLAWTLYDQLTDVPGSSPQELVSQIKGMVVHVRWITMLAMGFGVLVATRVVYGLLRTPWRDG